MNRLTGAIARPHASADRPKVSAVTRLKHLARGLVWGVALSHGLCAAQPAADTGIVIQAVGDTPGLDREAQEVGRLVDRYLRHGGHLLRQTIKVYSAHPNEADQELPFWLPSAIAEDGECVVDQVRADYQVARVLDPGFATSWNTESLRTHILIHEALHCRTHAAIDWGDLRDYVLLYRHDREGYEQARARQHATVMVDETWADLVAVMIVARRDGVAAGVANARAVAAIRQQNFDAALDKSKARAHYTSRALLAAADLLESGGEALLPSDEAAMQLAMDLGRREGLAAVRAAFSDEERAVVERKEGGWAALEGHMRRIEGDLMAVYRSPATPADINVASPTSVSSPASAIVGRRAP